MLAVVCVCCDPIYWCVWWWCGGPGACCGVCVCVCGGAVVVGYSVCNNNYEFCIFSLDRACIYGILY